MNALRANGGLVSPVLMVVLGLLLLPMLSLSLLSWEETLLSRRYVLTRKVSLLLEYAYWKWAAAVDQGIPGFAPRPEPLYAAIEPWTSEILDGRWEGGDYRVVAGFCPDSYDADGRPETGIFLYNRSFGFPESPFVSGGYPVITVSVESSIGRCRKGLDVEVTWTPYRPPEWAALIAGGSLNLSGPLTITGTSAAAVAVGGAVSTSGEVSLLNGPGEPVDEAMDFSGRLANPYRVLDLPSASRYLEKRRFLNHGPPPWQGTVYIDGDYTGAVEGRGTLIVHNPSYDPVKYEASLLWSLGTDSSEFDPRYSHLDPANQPALLQPWGDGSFEGLIIADDFSPGPGHLTVLGQVIILSREVVQVGMDQGMSITYRRESISEHSHGECDLILSWRPSER
jgi:hypothetical protein